MACWREQTSYAGWRASVLAALLAACSSPTAEPPAAEPVVTPPSEPVAVPRDASARPLVYIEPRDAPVPTVSGAEPLIESGYRLYLPTNRPLRFPIVGPDELRFTIEGLPPLKPDTPYRDDESAGKLAQAFDRASSYSLRDSAHEPLYIIAEADVTLARLERIHAVVPTSMAPRLIVRHTMPGASAHNPPGQLFGYLDLPAAGQPLRKGQKSDMSTVAELARALVANPAPRP